VRWERCRPLSVALKARTLWGTLIGLLLIGVINNGMILSQIPAFWQLVVKGSILLAAVLYDAFRRQRRDDT